MAVKDGNSMSKRKKVVNPFAKDSPDAKSQRKTQGVNKNLSPRARVSTRGSRATRTIVEDRARRLKNMPKGSSDILRSKKLTKEMRKDFSTGTGPYTGGSERRAARGENESTVRRRAITTEARRKRAARHASDLKKRKVAKNVVIAREIKRGQNVQAGKGSGDAPTTGKFGFKKGRKVPAINIKSLKTKKGSAPKEGRTKKGFLKRLFSKK